MSATHQFGLVQLDPFQEPGGQKYYNYDQNKFTNNFTPSNELSTQKQPFISGSQDESSAITMRPQPLYNYSSTINPVFTSEFQKIMPRQSDTFQVRNLLEPSSWVLPEPLVPLLNSVTEKTYNQPPLVKDNLSIVDKEVERSDEVPSDISDWVIEHMNEIDLQQLVGYDVVPEIMKEETGTADKDLEALLELNFAYNNNNQQNVDLLKYLVCSTPSPDNLVGPELKINVQKVPERIVSNQIPVTSNLYEPVTPMLSPDNHKEDQNEIHLTELKPFKSVTSGDQIFSALNFPGPVTNLIIPSTVDEKFLALPLEEVKYSINIQTQKSPSSKRPRKNCELDLHETIPNSYTLNKTVVEEVDFVLDSKSSSIDDDSNSSSSYNDGEWECTSNKRARWSIPGSSSNGKREKNNYSSKRSREKKVQIEKENEEKCNHLDIENRRLQIKSIKLKERIDELYKHQSNLLIHVKELLEKKF